METVLLTNSNLEITLSRDNMTEPGIGGEIQLTDAFQKLDSIYGATFEENTYD